MPATPTLDTKLAITRASTAPATGTYTCVAGCTLFTLSIVTDGATARAGGAPTYNGIALSQAATTEQAAVSPETTVELWYLLSPPTGSALSISVPNTGSAKFLTIEAASFTTAATYRYFFLEADVATNTSTNPTGPTHTGLQADDVIVAVVGSGATTWTNLTGRTGTQLYDVDDGSYGSGSQYLVKTNTTNQALSWTHATSDDWAIVSSVFRPYIDNPYVGAGGMATEGSATVSSVIVGMAAKVYPLVTQYASKPPLGTPVDWNNSLSQGLIAVYAFNEFGGSPVNILRPVTSALTGTPTWNSLGLRCTTAQSVDQVSLLPDVSAAYSFIIKATMDLSSTWTAFSAMFTRIATGSSAQFTLQGSASGSALVLGHGNASLNLTGMGTAWDDVRSHTYGITWNATSTFVNSFLDGLLKDKNLVYSTASAAGTGDVFINTYAGLRASGTYELILLYNRTLTQAEGEALTANPWQVFQPQTVFYTATNAVLATSTPSGGTTIGGAATVVTGSVIVHTPSGGVAIGGTATDYPLGGVACGGTNTVSLTSSVSSGMAIGGINTLALTSSVSSGSVIGGTALNYPLGGVTFGGTNTISLTSSVSSGVAIGGTNTLNLITTVSGGSVIGGTVLNRPTGGITIGGTNTLLIVSSVSSGAAIGGVNTLTLISSVGSGTIIGGTALNYPIGGVVSGGTTTLTLAVSVSGGICNGGTNTLSVVSSVAGGSVLSGTSLNYPIGGMVEGGSSTLALALAPNGGVVLGGINTLIVASNVSNGTVIGNIFTDTHEVIGSSTSRGLTVSGTTNISLTVSFDGGVAVSNNGIDTNEIIVNAPDGGGVVNGTATDYPIGGMVTEGEGGFSWQSGSGNFEVTGIGGTVEGGINTLSLAFIVSGGMLNSGTTAVTIGTLSDGGLVVTGITPLIITSSVSEGVVIDNDFTATNEVIGSSTSNGLVAGGSTTLTLVEIIGSGTVIGGINTLALTSSMSSGLLIGGTNNLLIGSSISNGVVTGGFYTASFVLNPTSGMSIGGINALLINSSVSNGMILGGINTLALVNTVNGGLVSNGTVPILINVIMQNGTVTGGLNSNKLEVLTSGGMVVGGFYTASYLLLPSSGVTVSGDNADTIRVLMITQGGTVLNGAGVEIAIYIVIPVSGMIGGGKYLAIVEDMSLVFTLRTSKLNFDLEP